MKAFIFGAGSSFGTLGKHHACPPLAKDFGASLSKQNNFPNRYPNLSLAANHVGTTLAKIGLEEIWTCLDYYKKFRWPPGLGPQGVLRLGSTRP